MNQIFSHLLTDTAIQRRAQVFTILEEICQELEWTQTQFEKARTSYEAVANWLAGSSDPMLASLHVYLHGSGALGTSIKPIGRDEFDVDLISFILGLGPAIAPARLKAAIGKRLREHAYYASILEEKKRCWRLNYAGDFHLDISPTIANPNCMNGGELVPDRKLRDWHATNPRAYRALFDERAALVPRMTQSIIAAQRDAATTEPFPVRQSVKGILRRTVQLLKRHRDLEFLHVQEEIAPISIIITTLAMRSYEVC
ncbi:nucleotidyltransferase, partial [Salipiger sp. P9]|uniref:nucleotidyltransferase domain-containing protein n=1 Tax=Salipiger pentaromativorans TaxID=2943193 RepID=UPI002157A528